MWLSNHYVVCWNQYCIWTILQLKIRKHTLCLILQDFQHSHYFAVVTAKSHQDYTCSSTIWIYYSFAVRENPQNGEPLCFSVRGCLMNQWKPKAPPLGTAIAQNSVETSWRPMAPNSASGLLFCLFIMFIRNQAGFKHFNNFKLVN